MLVLSIGFIKLPHPMDTSPRIMGVLEKVRAYVDQMVCKFKEHEKAHARLHRLYKNRWQTHYKSHGEREENMDALKMAAFVVTGLAMFIFLSWLIYTLSGHNIKNILRVVKYVLIVSTSVGIAVWIIKAVLTYVFLSHVSAVDIPSITLGLDIITCLVNWLIWALTVKKMTWDQRKVFSDSLLPFSNISVLFIISIVGIPIFNLLDIWYLVSLYILK